MLLVAAVVFTYYTTWALLLVRALAYTKDIIDSSAFRAYFIIAPQSLPGTRMGYSYPCVLAAHRRRRRCAVCGIGTGQRSQKEVGEGRQGCLMYLAVWVDANLRERSAAVGCFTAANASESD